MNFFKIFESKKTRADREELENLRTIQADEAQKRLQESDKKTKELAERDLTPWADISYNDGKMQVNSYNDKFVEDLKLKLGYLTDGLNNDQIIDLFTNRENIELEEPRLDVVHSGVDEDGRIKMQLDWNPSFIRHLADNGIQAESEEETIQMYLSLLTHQAAEDIIPEMLSKEDIDAAFHDLDEESKAELDEAARQIEERAIDIKKNRKKLANKKGTPRV